MLNRRSPGLPVVLAAPAIAVAAFICYTMTVCPTLDFIDSGELATVAYTLGISHPTGYSLFALVGRLFSHIPLGLRPILQLNILSAVLCSAAVFFFFHFLVQLLTDVRAIMSAGRKKSILFPVIPAALAGTAAAAFSETFWTQALAIEVYPLHLLLLSLNLLLFTRGMREVRDGGDTRWLLLFAFVLGLAFTNHMTTILLAPGFLYLYFAEAGWGRTSFRRILWMAGPFLLGFSLQLYLPVRAAGHPIMNWGNPVDFDRWLTHFSGKVYRVWIFSSTESASKQLSYFINSLGAEFAWIWLIPAAGGIVRLFAGYRKLLIFTLLLFFGCLLYAINYDIHDIDSYFLLAYLTVAIWAAVGTDTLLGYIRSRQLRVPALVVLGLCVVWNVITMKPRVDESGNTVVEQYTRDLLSTVEPNGVVISYQWDYFVSAANYLQVVEKVRPDVAVVDKELMRRSWYYPQLGQRYPWLMAGSGAELELFLKELDKFEHNEPYDPQTIELRYVNLIGSIIRNNIGTRAVYVTFEIEPQYTRGYTRIPWGIPFRLFTTDERREPPGVTFMPVLPGRRDTYVEGITAQYAQAYMNNALYAEYQGEKVRAREYAGKVLMLDPASNGARAMLDRLH